MVVPASLVSSYLSTPCKASNSTHFNLLVHLKPNNALEVLHALFGIFDLYAEVVPLNDCNSYVI